MPLVKHSATGSPRLSATAAALVTEFDKIRTAAEQKVKHTEWSDASRCEEYMLHTLLHTLFETNNLTLPQIVQFPNR